MLDRGSDGWAKVRAGSVVGLVPSAYLEEADEEGEEDESEESEEEEEEDQAERAAAAARVQAQLRRPVPWTSSHAITER